VRAVRVEDMDLRDRSWRSRSRWGWGYGTELRGGIYSAEEGVGVEVVEVMMEKRNDRRDEERDARWERREGGRGSRG